MTVWRICRLFGDGKWGLSLTYTQDFDTREAGRRFMASRSFVTDESERYRLVCFKGEVK